MKELIEKIDVGLQDVYDGRIAYIDLINRIKQDILAEQDRIVKELVLNDSHDYYPNVALDTTIKIVKGESTT